MFYMKPSLILLVASLLLVQHVRGQDEESSKDEDRNDEELSTAAQGYNGYGYQPSSEYEGAGGRGGGRVTGVSFENDNSYDEGYNDRGRGGGVRAVGNEYSGANNNALPDYRGAGSQGYSPNVGGGSYNTGYQQPQVSPGVGPIRTGSQGLSPDYGGGQVGGPGGGYGGTPYSNGGHLGGFPPGVSGFQPGLGYGGPGSYGGFAGIPGGNFPRGFPPGPGAYGNGVGGLAGLGGALGGGGLGPATAGQYNVLPVAGYGRAAPAYGGGNEYSAPPRSHYVNLPYANSRVQGDSSYNSRY